MRICLAISFFCVCQFCWSSGPVAHEGSVVLQNGEVLTGQIYMPSFELIFLVSEEQRIALPAHKIQQVRFYDAAIDVNRKFEVYRSADGGISGALLYEIVLFGDVKVLRRPKVSAQLISGASHADYLYYFSHNDSIEDLIKFNRLLFSKIKSELGEPLTSFMRVNDLYPDNIVDAMRIIKFYNSAKHSHQVIADLGS